MKRDATPREVVARNSHRRPHLPESERFPATGCPRCARPAGLAARPPCQFAFSFRAMPWSGCTQADSCRVAFTPTSKTGPRLQLTPASRVRNQAGAGPREVSSSRRRGMRPVRRLSASTPYQLAARSHASHSDPSRSARRSPCASSCPPSRPVSLSSFQAP